MATTLQQWLDETLAVIVLYKTPLTQSVTFNSWLASLQKHEATLDWFVYDNSPTHNHDLIAPDTFQLLYQHDPSNPGVSRAYNEGHEKAMVLGKKWLILLDQDTDFGLDTVVTYYQAMLAYPRQFCFVPRLQDKRGIISPFRFGLGNGIRLKSVTEGVKSLNQMQFVNSGMMISVDAFGRTSGYDEDFPLDYSDYAFVERLRMNFSSFVLISLRAQHYLASSSDAGKENEILRFENFTKASGLFRKKYHPYNWLIVIRPLLRAVKLSVSYKNLVFLKKYITG